MKPTRADCGLLGAGLLFGLACVLAACSAAPPTSSAPRPKSTATASEVVVMGTIHDGHRTSALYGTKKLEAILRRVRPTFVLAEIPPDRLEAALAQFRAGLPITEPRVSRFPEYVDVIIPLMDELGYTIVACAGWTKAMAEARSAALKAWKISRPVETNEVEAAMAEAEAAIEKKHWQDDPAGIHTDAYDELVAAGMEPYDRLFNRDLGPGGWSNINRAHYRLIDRAISQYGGPGVRFLVTFGAWHKYWLRRKLAERPGVTLIPLSRFLR